MIHNSSVIDKKAIIAKSVKIGPFCFVGPDVELSDGVELVSNVHIEGNTKIGKGTKIFPFASIGTMPQDLKYKGESNSVLIGENNMIREYLVSFEYLQQRFANIGLRVITEREATDLGLSKGTGLFREL